MSRVYKYDVFISHSDDDRHIAQLLAANLRNLEFEVWGGSRKRKNSYKYITAMEDSAVCILLFGPSGKSPWADESVWSAILSRIERTYGIFRVIPIIFSNALRGKESRSCSLDRRCSRPEVQTFVQFQNSFDDDDAIHQLVLKIRGVDEVEHSIWSNSFFRDMVRRRAKNALNVDWKKLRIGLPEPQCISSSTTKRTLLPTDRIISLIKHLKRNRYAVSNKEPDRSSAGKIKIFFIGPQNVHLETTSAKRSDLKSHQQNIRYGSDLLSDKVHSEVATHCTDNRISKVLQLLGNFWMAARGQTEFGICEKPIGRPRVTVPEDKTVLENRACASAEWHIPFEEEPVIRCGDSLLSMYFTPSERRAKRQRSFPQDVLRVVVPCKLVIHDLKGQQSQVALTTQLEQLTDNLERLRESAQALLDEVEVFHKNRPARARDGIVVRHQLRRYEFDLMCDALRRNENNQSRAVELLGMKLVTLRYRVNQCDIAYNEEENRDYALERLMNPFWFGFLQSYLKSKTSDVDVS